MKLGGFNQHVKWTEETQFMDDRSLPTMVIGVDITHALGRPSVISITGSVDRFVTTYVSEIGLVRPREHRGPREHVNAAILVPAFKAVLRLYYARNGNTPLRVIVYRDGVSEGQLQNTLNDEVSALKRFVITIIIESRANSELYDEINESVKEIMVTYITVQKRHSIR